jgi:hypothetical protein
MRDLGQDVDTTLATALNANDYAGLVLVKKQIIGSAVSSIVVSNAFSATYENYKVIITGGAGSTNIDFTLQFTGITGGVYYGLAQTQTWGTGAITGLSTFDTSMYWFGGANGADSMYGEFDVRSPFLTKRTTAFCNVFGAATGQPSGPSRWFVNATTSTTGFTLATNTGTVTGGTIYVYGYGTS